MTPQEHAQYLKHRTDENCWKKAMANVGLAVNLAKKHNRGRPQVGYDVFLVAGMEGLFWAAKQWEPKKGAYSTWAVWRMRDRMNEVWRGWRMGGESKKTTWQFNEGLVRNMAEAEKGMAEAMDNRALAARALAVLTPTERALVELWMVVGKQKRVAEMMGVSRQYIGQVFNRARVKMQWELSGNGKRGGKKGDGNPGGRHSYLAGEEWRG